MKKFLIVSIMVLVITTFAFTQKSIKVNSPNGGEQWLRGNIKPITWTSTNLTNGVKITLWKSGVFKGVIKKDQPKNGTFSWTVGHYENGSIAAYGPDYKVKVREQGGDAFTTEDSSDENFRIKSKFIAAGNIPVFKKKPVFKPKPGMFKPKITAALDVPLGALKPSTKLYLKGKNFGTQKGKILIYGDFPNNPTELINVKWESSTKVNGIVPQSMNGYKNQTVGVVVKTSYNAKSDPWNMGFEGREEKILTGDAVGVQCGTDANDNICNSFSDSESEFVQGCSNEYAICGWHQNAWGAVGDDTGNDIFYINLKNGWVFKSMEILKWYKSSGDEHLNGPTPTFPAGQSSWTPVINWKVSPNDSVKYHIKIIVEGPIGTNYK